MNIWNSKTWLDEEVVSVLLKCTKLNELKVIVYLQSVLNPNRKYKKDITFLDISKATGIFKTHLSPILQKLVNDKMISKVDGKYTPFIEGEEFIKGEAKNPLPPIASAPLPQDTEIHDKDNDTSSDNPKNVVGYGNVNNITLQPIVKINSKKSKKDTKHMIKDLFDGINGKSFSAYRSFIKKELDIDMEEQLEFLTAQRIWSTICLDNGIIYNEEKGIEGTKRDLKHKIECYTNQDFIKGCMAYLSQKKDKAEIRNFKHYQDKDFYLYFPLTHMIDNKIKRDDFDNDLLDAISDSLQIELHPYDCNY